jgi:hypothetical protein
MENYTSALKCPVDVGNLPNRTTLKTVFGWYISLKIPYETVSNLELSILVKTGKQMLGSVLAHDGGHCVEHSVLLAAILDALGFSCIVVNADYHNNHSGTVVKMAKPLVVVELQDESWVCDPYYRCLAQPIPAVGETRKSGDILVYRESPSKFRISKLIGGVVADEDRVNMEWTIHERRIQFEQRYKDFSPFGITAPLFQLIRPVRTGLFYSPEHDSLLVSESSTYRLIENKDLEHEHWIPKSFKHRILKLLPEICQTRTAAYEFIKTGLFPPSYIGNKPLPKQSVTSTSPSPPK